MHTNNIGVSCFEFMKNFTDPETRVIGGDDTEDFVILACTVLIE